jgi:hypothetical protein
MSDFLSRLIERTSGTAVVVRPLVRPGYGALPPAVPPAGDTETAADEATANIPAAMPAVSPESPAIPRRTSRSEAGEPAPNTRKRVASPPQAAKEPVSARSDVNMKGETRPAAPVSGRRKTEQTVASVVAKERRTEPAIRQTIVAARSAAPPSVPARTPVEPATRAIHIDEAEKPGTAVPVTTVVNTKERIVDIKRETTGLPAVVTRGGQTEARAAVAPESVVRAAEARQVVQPGRPAERNLARERAIQPPDIKVTIGRIEVRADPPPPPAPPRAAVKRGPAVSLESYLKGREEGNR